MDISVVIPTFNRSGQLRRCIDSLLKQDFKGKYEIIVIDDGSNDGTSKVEDIDKKIQYFYQHNKGPGAARNLGISKARGKIIAFTDDDCVLPKSWLSSIVSAGSDAVGGPIMNPIGGYVAWSLYLLQFSSWLPNRKNGYINNIPTANIAYKAETIKDIKFDERSSRYGYEDSLFNHFYLKKGKKIMFTKDIAVKHYGSGSLRRLFDIQKRTALGFIKDGYIVHGKIGKLLMKYRILNLFCPDFIYILMRCCNSYFLRFLYCSPLIYAGCMYKSWVIIQG